MNLETLVKRLSFITSEIANNNQELQSLNDYLFSENNIISSKDDLGKDDQSTGLLLQLERTIDRLHHEKDKQIGLIVKTKGQVYETESSGPVSCR